MSGVLASATVQGIRSLKDRTCRLTIDLQEQTPENYSRLFSMIDEFVKFYMTTDNITADETEIIDSEIIDNESKTPSQRLRNVLYRLWEQDQRGYEDYNLYYRYMMGRIIDRYKQELE